MKCEMCGYKIVGGIKYVKAKIVCKKCFKKNKQTQRAPRSMAAFLKF